MFLNKIDARNYFSQLRKNISLEKRINANKLLYDNLICSHLLDKFETVLCYISVNDEADTEKIINYLLKNGKTVYIPYCEGKNMHFYQLGNINELINGKFGIPTVPVDNKYPLNDFCNSICIVPALSFDSKGFRLGYGGGYYDRFFADNNNIYKLGLAFDCCLTDELPHESFDISVDAIVTDREIKIIGKL